jgi:HD-GYP domain-containing protein (c-di-GMP phosphodiesterase class II)
MDGGRVMGDFADQKSALFAGHSAQVADLAVSAAGRLGLPHAEQQTLRFAALARDLGRVGISTAIWDKPGRLTDGEWESVRLHAYYSERMLLKVPALAEAARLAGAHHEQCDGSGYRRGSRAQSVLSCVLAAADAYVAMRNARAWRPTLDPGQAAQALFVAPKTVDFHLQNIYAKAAVTTRAGAALFAVQNDLLPS